MDLTEDLPCWSPAIKDSFQTLKVPASTINLELQNPAVISNSNISNSSIPIMKIEETQKITESSQPYQKVLDWGRQEHFFKLANIFHTNNY